MPEVTLQDISLHYEIDGSGPPLVLLAGMLSDSASWTPVVGQLAQSFTVIRPDNRLTGRTTPALSPASPQLYAADTLGLLDHLGIEKTHLLGHSMGGLIAMELNAIAPDRIDTTTLAGISPTRNPRLMAWFDTVMALRRDGPKGLWLRALLSWLMRSEFYADPANLNAAVTAGLAYPHAQSADQMAAQIAALKAYRPGIAPKDVTTPTHVILAKEDSFIPFDSAHAALAEIENVNFTTLHDAGHSMHWDAPDVFAQAVTTYIKDRS